MTKTPGFIDTDPSQAKVTITAKYGVIEKADITPLAAGFTRIEAVNMEDCLYGLKIHEIDDFRTVCADLGSSPHIHLVAGWLNGMFGKESS